MLLQVRLSHKGFSFGNLADYKQDHKDRPHLLSINAALCTEITGGKRLLVLIGQKKALGMRSSTTVHRGGTRGCWLV